MLTLNLQKSEETLKLCLAKAGIHTPPVVEVAFNMDVSGSFRHEHATGHTNILMNRLVPWGMVFDPDKKLDFFAFSDGRENVEYVGAVTSENCEDFMEANVIENVRGWCGGTTYADVLKENLILFGWDTGTVTKKAPSFLGNLFSFGKKKEKVAEPRRSLIIHVTDGETSDERRTYDLIQSMLDKGHKVYIQFFGMGLSKGSRGDSFLEHLANKFPNVGYCRCESVSKFNDLSDEEINDLIISDELISWLTA